MVVDLGRMFGFVEQFITRSGSRSAVVLCGDINRGFCDQIALFVRGLGVDVDVYEVIRARQRERMVGPALRIARNPLLVNLVIPLFVIQPLLWFILMFAQVRASKKVVEGIAKSDSVIWVGLHDDFDVYLLVDKKIRKAVRDKHTLLLTYPSIEIAKKLGIPYEEYFNSYINACNTPWEEMKDIADKLMKQISSSNSLRVWTPQGADFTVHYDLKQIAIWYGVIDKKALEKGRLVLLLPAGELSIISNKKPLNISGKIYSDIPNILYDQVVSGVEIVAENGYVVKYSAEKGREALDKHFRLRGSRKIHEFSFGLNPAIKPCGSIYLDEKAYRTIHIGLGRPYTPLHIDFVIPNPRIYIDSRELTW